jgi:uncharacterized protein (TIGR02284 family)
LAYELQALHFTWITTPVQGGREKNGMTDEKAAGGLNRLHRLCRAGEQGFEVVSQNVSNRGLKFLLKSYAQQRADFAGEIEDEIRRLGGDISERRSIRGVIHRGRINIRSALTIGHHHVENVALGEAMHGENAVLKAYRGALDRELPAETQAVVERQLKEIEDVRNQVDLLRGQSGKRLVVRLFDSPKDAESAIQALEKANFQRSDIEIEDVRQLKIYEGKGSKVSDVVVSGAIGGGLWGALIGAVTGVGALFIPGMGTMIADDTTATWVGITVAGIVFGALFGAILGFAIGRGVYEEDIYLYDDSLLHGTTLLHLLTDNDRAPEAARIMHQINAAARAHPNNQGAAEEVGEAEGVQVN